jgi:hypothetical protein
VDSLEQIESLVRGFTNSPIGEALAASGSEQRIVTGAIVKAELGAAVVTEIELSEVAVKMGFAAMLMDAGHAALEH